MYGAGLSSNKQLGWTDFYLRNSNLHVKSECDHTSGSTGLKTGLGSLGSLVEEEVLPLLDLSLLRSKFVSAV